MTVTPMETVEPEQRAKAATDPRSKVGRPSRLRWLLVGLDGALAFTAWGLTLPWHLGPGDGPPAVAVLTGAALASAATVTALHAQGLYLARTCAVRATEVAGAARAALVGALVVALVAGPADSGVLMMDGQTATLGAICTFLGVVAGRGCFRSWLDAHRRVGRFTTNVIVVGDNDEGRELCELLADHPEAGFRVAGVVGHHDDQRWQVSACIPHLGPAEQVTHAAVASGSSGVIVAAGALDPVDINRLVRECHQCGLHVHLSSGLRGIDQRRIRHRPVAHEPLLYVEPLHLAPWQQAVKRVIDVVGATVLGLVSLPVLLVAAVAIRREDGGPVLFRQERVGREGQPFTVLKLRTMVPDAEHLLDQVREHNERAGPLFKQVADPRRTRAGSILERLSLDELPQLWNVLRGDMSLVGPRPALASEVDQFDEELLARLRLLPGITGLWQVEARDNPSFGAYRRFDLFYVENWSVMLDIAILLGTVKSVLVRALPQVRPRARVDLEGATGLPAMGLVLDPAIEPATGRRPG
jgi:exopolysaccharide biosynthesis polyprenyl glycosylphosphotransferase